jgi:hypothetical protein
MRNVLVVGGSAVVERMSRVLGVLGFRRMQTRSTRMAVALVRELPFHAVVLDLGAIPDALDGLVEALHRLQPTALLLGVGEVAGEAGGLDVGGLDDVVPLGAPIPMWGRALGVAATRRRGALEQPE